MELPSLVRGKEARHDCTVVPAVYWPSQSIKNTEYLQTCIILAPGFNYDVQFIFCISIRNFLDDGPLPMLQ